MTVAVVFLTGQSNKQSCALSPVQQAFMQQLLAEGVTGVPLNFPYNSALLPYRQVNLFSASLANSRLYLSSRRGSFKAQYREAVAAVLSRYSKTLVLAGSCGIELLNNLQLDASFSSRLHILAYGPVGRCRPAFDTTLVQGQQDWLSRWFFPAVDIRIDSGHMAYLQSAQLLDIARSLITQLRETVPDAG
ncbi:hypothetical protein [Rheinheimera sp.]|jgi:hypothetical protein|uniref:hypothetical protein n=2 Tax=Rheinheimera sp. TaxID=1869214 RepID=UPI00404898FD